MFMGRAPCFAICVTGFERQAVDDMERYEGIHRISAHRRDRLQSVNCQAKLVRQMFRGWFLGKKARNRCDGGPTGLSFCRSFTTRNAERDSYILEAPV
jgi:hypothetical protein